MHIDIQANTATDMIVDSAVLQALRDAPLLAAVDEPVLQRLAPHANIAEFAEEIVLCRQGEAADKLYVVMEGQLAGFNVAPNGSIAVIEVARPGETLSLASLLARLPRLVGVRTVTRCRLLTIEAAALLSLIDQEPQLVAALLRAEANEFRALVRQVCDLKLRTTAQRLGCYLLSLSSDERANTTALRLPFDKRLLAARLGCRQENLSRAFAALRSFGVETHGARVILHDIARLRAYSEPDEAVI
jgi:CRP-like cAMP-binding protein